jgi:hypothetical protein
MPVINTVASMSSHAFGGIYFSQGNPKSINRNISLISPAVGGKTGFTTTETFTIDSCGTWTVTPLVDFYSNVKIWGGGGGASLDFPPGAGGSLGVGGDGGYSQGNVRFVAGATYQFIVGCGGSGISSARAGGAGGGGTGIQIVSGSEAILVTGGGGGSGYSGSQGVPGAPGGGSTAGAGGGNAGGGGGSQSAAGAGGVGTRHSGSPGVGRNGGVGYAGSGTGGIGFGNGGGTSFDATDSGAGAGGGGYYGGRGGGGNADGSGGGGGSGYYSPTYVTRATLTSGYVSSTGRGTAAQGGRNGSSGTAGKITLTQDSI